MVGERGHRNVPIVYTLSPPYCRPTQSINAAR